MKTRIDTLGILAGAVLAGSISFGAAAPLPDNPKSVIYFGWDTLGATTADVYRNREQFASTGFDGICMPLTGKTAKGADFNGRRPMCGTRFTREQFAASIDQIREMMKMKGLSGSYLMVYWMSSPRMKWADDAAWETFAANMKLLGEIAKETGLKGLFIDHEDYTGKPLFTWRADDDPPYDETLRLARRRGSQIIKATAAGFPGGRIINDRLLLQNDECARSQQPLETLRICRHDLWSAFVNGVLEAKPADFSFDDGCEHAYGAMTEKDYLALKGRAMIQGLPFVEKDLRAKFLTSTGICYGKWMDRWFRKKDLPFDPGRFTESFWGAGVNCDGVYWVYGEKNVVVKWGRKVHSRVDCEKTWNDLIDDLPMILRTSVGDYTLLKERIAAGTLANLVSNPACNSSTGKLPAPYRTYVEKKDVREGMFAWDRDVGCGAPGSLRLAGRGCITLEARGLKPYDRIFVTVAAKGAEPVVNVVWRTKGAYEWYLDYQFMARPQRTTPDGWKIYETALIVPSKKSAAVAGDAASAPSVDQVDSVGLIMSGSRGPETTVWFDDISIYRF